jgi:hypothetical protein
MSIFICGSIISLFDLAYIGQKMDFSPGKRIVLNATSSMQNDSSKLGQMTIQSTQRSGQCFLHRAQYTPETPQTHRPSGEFLDRTKVVSFTWPVGGGTASFHKQAEDVRQHGQDQCC